MNNLYNLEIDITDRYIEDPQFTTYPPKNLQLIDPVITYNDGRNYKVIPLDIFRRYPVIHDKYYDFDKNKNKNKKNKLKILGFVSDISINCCPFTLFTTIFFGKYQPTNKLFNNNIVLRDTNYHDNILIPILGQIYSEQNKIQLNKFIRRHEAKIMTLRNAISKFPDCQFIKIDKILDPIVDNQYYQNDTILYPLKQNNNNKYYKFHPKTLIYGIEYFTSQYINSKKKKYSAIFSNDSSKNRPNNYDIQNNGIERYFDQMIEKIREKGGLILPCLWFAWYSTFPDTKIFF